MASATPGWPALWAASPLSTRVPTVSPVLANLYLHYAFDAWMAWEFPTVPFERYVDDVVVRCGQWAAGA
jgi:hypothetical protein